METRSCAWPVGFDDASTLLPVRFVEASQTAEHWQRRASGATGPEPLPLERPSQLPFLRPRCRWSAFEPRMQSGGRRPNPKAPPRPHIAKDASGPGRFCANSPARR